MKTNRELSLFEQWKKYNKRRMYPFHMPGHKGNTAFLPEAENLLTMDLTEVESMDNLHAPLGCIRETQRRVAEIYGAAESFLLVNGATAGVIAAIGAVCGDGDRIAIARNSHKSAYSGMAWSGAYPVYFFPEHTRDGLSGGVSPRTVETVFERASDVNISGDSCSNIKAVLITSPTYEGFVSDIACIADIVHKYRAFLIVDEAHGAHFPFHKTFPNGALQSGADLVIQSFHKTLPAFSQSSVLHVSERGIKYLDMNRMQQALSCLQTSSPSYLMMITADYMLQKIWEDSKKDNVFFGDYIKRLMKLRNALSFCTAFRLSGIERVGEAGIFGVDIGKLLLSTLKGVNGGDIARRLADEYRIQLEMANKTHLLAMTSVADTDEGFSRFEKAVMELDVELTKNKRFCLNEYGVDSENDAAKFIYTQPEQVISPRAAMKLPVSEARLSESIGEISASFLAAYPPGIPILAPGERITGDVLIQAEAHGLLDSFVLRVEI